MYVSSYIVAKQWLLGVSDSMPLTLAKLHNVIPTASNSIIFVKSFCTILLVANNLY